MLSMAQTSQVKELIPSGIGNNQTHCLTHKAPCCKPPHANTQSTCFLFLTLLMQSCPLKYCHPVHSNLKTSVTAYLSEIMEFCGTRKLSQWFPTESKGLQRTMELAHEVGEFGDPPSTVHLLSKHHPACVKRRSSVLNLLIHVITSPNSQEHSVIVFIFVFTIRDSESRNSILGSQTRLNEKSSGLWTGVLVLVVGSPPPLQTGRPLKGKMI